MQEHGERPSAAEVPHLLNTSRIHTSLLVIFVLGNEGNSTHWADEVTEKALTPTLNMTRYLQIKV